LRKGINKTPWWLRLFFEGRKFSKDVKGRRALANKRKAGAQRLRVKSGRWKKFAGKSFFFHLKTRRSAFFSTAVNRGKRSRPIFRFQRPHPNLGLAETSRQRGRRPRQMEQLVGRNPRKPFKFLKSKTHPLKLMAWTKKTSKTSLFCSVGANCKSWLRGKQQKTVSQ